MADLPSGRQPFLDVLLRVITPEVQRAPDHLSAGGSMPFINVRTAKGLLDEQQKQELHQRLTDLMVEVEGRGSPAFRQLVFVLIEEEASTNWSVGGVQVTPEQLQTLRLAPHEPARCE
jgi:4-oxalocrotonate tautomerase